MHDSVSSYTNHIQTSLVWLQSKGWFRSIYVSERDGVSFKYMEEDLLFFTWTNVLLTPWGLPSFIRCLWLAHYTLLHDISLWLTNQITVLKCQCKNYQYSYYVSDWFITWTKSWYNQSKWCLEAIFRLVDGKELNVLSYNLLQHFRQIV